MALVRPEGSRSRVRLTADLEMHGLRQGYVGPVPSIGLEVNVLRAFFEPAQVCMAPPCPRRNCFAGRSGHSAA
jgi:hypothetical protein